MKLVLIRHGIAEDAVEFAHTGEPDDERPLAALGRRRVNRVARGLTEVIKQYDLLASSPLARAVQTAELIVDAYKGPAPVVIPSLAPTAGFDVFFEWLKRQDVPTVLAVGHEPHIGGLASWLLTGQNRALFEMKKGGAALLEFDGALLPGRAHLRWLLAPAQLRLIGD